MELLYLFINQRQEGMLKVKRGEWLTMEIQISSKWCLRATKRKEWQRGWNRNIYTNLKHDQFIVKNYDKFQPRNRCILNSTQALLVFARLLHEYFVTSKIHTEYIHEYPQNVSKSKELSMKWNGNYRDIITQSQHAAAHWGGAPSRVCRYLARPCGCSGFFHITNFLPHLHIITP